VKTVITLAILLVAFPGWARAQIDLTWDNCVLRTGTEPFPTANKNFGCTGSETHRLHAAFKTPVAIPDFFAMDVVLDLVWTKPSGNRQDQSLQPFWHFETGGCNATGVVLSADKSASGDVTGGCGMFTTPWGAQGESATFAAITVYVPDYWDQPGRGYLLASISRDSQSPFALQAGTNYYAFHLNWNTAAGGTCLGCADQIVVVWESASLYTMDNQTITLLGRSAKTTENYASINGALLTDVVPVQKTTWGRIKAQYR